jgi:hypothetical protein
VVVIHCSSRRRCRWIRRPLIWQSLACASPSRVTSACSRCRSWVVRFQLPATLPGLPANRRTRPTQRYAIPPTLACSRPAASWLVHGPLRLGLFMARCVLACPWPAASWLVHGRPHHGFQVRSYSVCAPPAHVIGRRSTRCCRARWRATLNQFPVQRGDVARDALPVPGTRAPRSTILKPALDRQRNVSRVHQQNGMDSPARSARVPASQPVSAVACAPPHESTVPTTSPPRGVGPHATGASPSAICHLTAAALSTDNARVGAGSLAACGGRPPVLVGTQNSFSEASDTSTWHVS